MNWITIYITGQADFKDDVRKKLDRSDVEFIPGYIENSSASNPYDLYWLNGHTDLRQFKEAIGGKLIWKYRLHFFNNLEEFIAFQNETLRANDFTAHDLKMIAEMQAAEENSI
jgi:hypothetical protein